MRIIEQMYKQQEEEFKIDLAYEEWLREFIDKPSTSINNPNYIPPQLGA